jgi:uncharacterized membrane protein YfcA
MGTAEFLSGIPLVLCLIGLGFLAGGYGTLVGIGGAVVLTPVLLILYPDAQPGALTSVTMGVVFINALSGTVAYVRQRRIDFRNGLLFALATVPGTVFGVWTLGFVPQQIFEIIFGLALLVFSVIIWMRPGIDINPGVKPGHKMIVITDCKGETFTYTCNRSLGILLSFGVGFIAGLLGIGGGIIHVPALIYMLGFPAHIATATSHFILVFTGLAGTITHTASGVYAQSWQILLWIALGVIPGAQLGAWLSPKLKGALLIRLLVLALALGGVRLVIAGIMG